MAILGIFNVHRTVRVDLSHHIGTGPTGPQLARKQVEARIIQQNFTPHREMLADYALVMEGLSFCFVSLQTLIEFSSNLLQLVELELSPLTTRLNIKI